MTHMNYRFDQEEKALNRLCRKKNAINVIDFIYQRCAMCKKKKWCEKMTNSMHACVSQLVMCMKMNLLNEALLL